MYEYEQEASRFRTELLGFNRVEVLTYIERISAANAEKAQALETTISDLQQKISGAHQREETLKQKARQVLHVLETQKKRAEDATAEANQLRTEVGKANDEIAAMRSRLFAQEQKNAALKNENSELSATVDELTRTLSHADANGMHRNSSPVYGNSYFLQQAEARAQSILKSADKQAAEQIVNAKERADTIVAQAKVEKAKAQAQLSESADGIAASIAVLKAQLSAVDEKILAATGDLQRATDGIAAALGNTERSLSELGAQMQKLSRPYTRPQQSPVYAQEEYPVQQDMEYRCNPHQTESVPDDRYDRSSYEVPHEENVQNYYSVPEAAGGNMVQKNTEPSRYAPLQYHPVQPERYPGVMEDQYDLVQHEVRDGVQMPYDMTDTMLSPAIIEGKDACERDSSGKFGKIHTPHAMPFQPFEPDVPHTAPYGRENRAGLSSVNVPPAPPPKETGKKREYVPQPTPVGPNRMATDVLEQKQEKIPEPIAAVRTDRHAVKPKIIPYSMPIPSNTGIGFDQTPHERQYFHVKGKDEYPEDLLENLKSMLNDKQ